MPIDRIKNTRRCLEHRIKGVRLLVTNMWCALDSVNQKYTLTKIDESRNYEILFRMNGTTYDLDREARDRPLEFDREGRIK